MSRLSLFPPKRAADSEGPTTMTLATKDVSDVETPESPEALSTPGYRKSSLLARYGAVGLLGLLVVVFSALKPDTFPTNANLTTLLSTQTVVVILALGALLPLVCGEFDLSVGYVLGFSAMQVAVLTGSGMNWVLALLSAVGVGAVIGLLNGVLVVKVGINAFVATLGSGTLLSGITVWMSNGQVVFKDIPSGFLQFGRKSIFGLQYPVFWMIAIAAVLYYVLNYTPFGRSLYAIGGGREAARLAGLPTVRHRMVAFVLASSIAAFAGVLTTATLGSAQPDRGPTYLLPAFAACFLGATMIRPGRFNVMGAVIALFLLGVGVNGLQQLGAPFWLPNVFNGAALLVAVGLTQLRRGSRSSRT